MRGELGQYRNAACSVSSMEIRLYPRATRPTTAEEHAVDALRTRLEPYAKHLRQVSIRFDDVIRPSGKVDRSCRVDVTLAQVFDSPKLSVEGRAPNERHAADAAADGVEGAVRREVEEVERRRSRGSKRKAKAKSAGGERVVEVRREETEATEGLSEYDILEEQARQGRHATPRAVKTANPMRGRHIHKTQRQSRATAAKEISATRPSRKSTRRSANRVKRDSNLARQTKRAVGSPKQRASAAQARGTHA